MIKHLLIPCSLGLFVLLLGFAAPTTERSEYVAKFVQKNGTQQLVIDGQLAPSIYAPHGPKFEVGPNLWVSTDRIYNKPQSYLTLFRGDKPVGRLDLAEMARRWTRDDKVWGSHQEGNQMRYLHAGVYLRPQLSEVIPQGDGTALAILDYLGELTQSVILGTW